MFVLVQVPDDCPGDATTLIRDALSDFRAARTPVETYVSRRYDARNSPWAIHKIDEVTKRVVAAGRTCVQTALTRDELGMIASALEVLNPDSEEVEAQRERLFAFFRELAERA